MTTITIPKNLIKKDDLVIIPRKEYEELLSARRVREFYTELDKDLDMAIRDYRAGRAYGHFTTVEESRLSLESRRNKKK